MRIDLNADLGELGIDHDTPLLASITSASLAAGFHAGDPSSLRALIRLTKDSGVAIGAHPSFNDRAGFGRRDMTVTSSEAEDLVVYQIAAVAGVAAVEGVRLQHVKPHGALYNAAATDFTLAAAIVRGVAAVDPSLMLFAPSGSELLRAGRAAGLRVAAEGFADRAYQADGRLAPRDRPGAVVDEVDLVAARALQMVTDRSVVALDGTTIRIEVDTICLHGDTPGAAALARAVRSRLEHEGVVVRSP